VTRGIGIHIGLNTVDPNAYNGWDGLLLACEADAGDMLAISHSRGFEATTLLSPEATSGAVIDAIRAAAGKLVAGDLLFLSYSGHGGQVPDPTSEEADHLDETWVLWDRQLLDDELYALWAQFADGVRILVLSDSCHSGSVVREEFYAASPASTPDTRFKFLPRDIEEQTYRSHQAMYDSLQGQGQGDREALAASLILISGCQDNQYSRDGERNGLFTEQLRAVWSDGVFSGSYAAFHRAIGDQMPPDQTPNFMRIGTRNRNFEQQTPFTI
jgi:metacaspase-1